MSAEVTLSDDELSRIAEVNDPQPIHPQWVVRRMNGEEQGRMKPSCEDIAGTAMAFLYRYAGLICRECACQPGEEAIIFKDKVIQRYKVTYRL